MPFVSIVIPAYNCARFIGETIKSILAQEGAQEIEVIVVNDGSTDDTGDVARSFGPPVRVIDQPNSGVSSARNHGIRESKGDFIALVDADDYWLPNKLANQLAAFESHPDVDVVFSHFIHWFPDDAGGYKEPLSFSIQAEPQGIDGEFSGWIYHQMLLDSWVLTSTALARAQALLASGGFDESLSMGEDWEFWLRMSRKSQFIKLRETTTLYRQHPSQATKLTRPVDYRTRLLENTARQWGLSSSDGRCVTPERFRRQLALYSTTFGLTHLSGGPGASRIIAAKSFLKAWSIDPRYWHGLAYLALTAIGWRPKT